jgi:hypothetical protein
MLEPIDRRIEFSLRLFKDTHPLQNLKISGRQRQSAFVDRGSGGVVSSFFVRTRLLKQSTQSFLSCSLN